jgi:hypothetical protein
MHSHVVIQRSISIERPQSTVFDHVSDFERTAEWRDEVIESTQSPSGPMMPSTHLRETARVLGRRVVTDSVVDVVEPGHRFTQRRRYHHRRAALPHEASNR